jgi:hypothetical protein
MATWLWLGGWRPGRWPSWAPALALLLATLSCRGLYGYLILAIGIASALLTRWTRSRVVLAVLLVIPLLYIGSRMTGAWDGKTFVRWSAFTGRSGTVEYRFGAENAVIGRVLAYNPAFGSGSYIGNARLPEAIDGRWLAILWTGGLVGLTLQMTTFHILPAILALSRPRGRPDARQAASPSWGLACWCLLQMIDSLHNVSYFTPTGLVAGTLVGFSSWKGSDTFPSRPADGGVDGRRRPVPIPLIVTIVLLVGLEILGRWRDVTPSPSKPPTPEAGNREAHP